MGKKVLNTYFTEIFFTENLLEIQVEIKKKKKKQAWSTEISTYVYNCN